MKTTFKTIAVISTAALLAACGGSTGNVSTSSAPAPAAPEAAAPTESASAVQTPSNGIVRASFLSSGAVEQPKNWREWVYVGSPLTPNGLNGGAAPFPEFHNVYVEPSAFDHYEATGEWPQGTQIAKELVLVRDNNNAENGSTAEVSGIGYQQGEFQGLELAVKDNTRFADQPGGWAYFSFGHKAEPYEASAEAFPAEACNACHAASADTDFVFTQFYPVIRAAR